MARNDPKLSTKFWKVDKSRFEKRLRSLLKRTKDGRPAFHAIGQMFRQSRKTIFSLKGPGGYPDFKGGPDAPYPKRKEYLIGRKYPFLYLSGTLAESVTKLGADGNINIVKKNKFQFGTSIPYAKYHDSEQTPRTTIPQRKFIFWGPETRKFRNLTNSTRNFYGRAIKILENYIAREKLNQR